MIIKRAGIALIIAFNCYSSDLYLSFLNFPVGSRSLSAGGTGVANSADNFAPFFNPAALGVHNDKRSGGSVSVMYGPLIPAFKLENFDHIALAANYQDSNFIVQPSLFTHFVNYGDADESVYGLGCGIDLNKIGIKNQYAGISGKVVRSERLTQIGYDFYTAGSSNFAIDIGYLLKLGRTWTIGTSLMNMGPGFKYDIVDTVYPVPFSFNVAVGNHMEFPSKRIKIEGEFCVKRGIRKMKNGKAEPFYQALWDDFLHDVHSSASIQWQKLNERIGFEIQYHDIMSIRVGYSMLPIDYEYELTYGIGFHFLDHFNFDIGNNYSPEGFMKSILKKFDETQIGTTGEKHNQWHISLSVDNVTKIRKDDFVTRKGNGEKE